MADWVINRERRDRLLEVLFQIRPGEFPLTSLLFLHFFTVVGAISTGRTLRDSLFLAHYDKGALPWMYIFQAIVVALLSSIYARFADQIRKDHMAMWSGLALAASLLAFRVAIALLHVDWIYAALYVWTEVLASIAVIQFWNLANEMFNPREAKRLFGVVGSGGTFATILLGSATGAFARKFGTEALLYPCALMLGATFFIARAVGRRNASRLSRPRTKINPKQGGGLLKIIGSGHLRLVAVLGMATFITTTLVDYQFKSIAKSTFAHPDELTAFFGTFYAVCGGLSLGIQLAGSSRILSRFGVVVALTLLPVGLSMGTSVLIILPAALWGATWAKGADNVLRYTINDSTTQLLYMPVPANVRGAAKAAIDGVLKPGSIALAGVLLLAYKQVGLGARPVAVVTLLLIAGWLAGLARLRGQYITSLQDTLRRRRLDVDAHSRIADGSTAKVIVRALKSADSREVLNAIELFPHLPDLHLEDELGLLLAHADPAVRRATLEFLAKSPSLQHGNDVFQRFEDPDTAVRAAAVEAFCSIGRERSVRSVRGFLKDPDPAIRSAAIAGMIRYGGLDGVLSAAEALKALIGHADPVMREHAARVLGEIGVRNFYQPVLELMADKQLRVQLAAIEAAGRLKSIELAPALVYRLDRSETASAAVAALAEFGDAVVPILDRVLKNQVEDLTIRRNVPRVLAAIRSPRAMSLLLEHLEEADERLRQAVCQAVRRAARRNRSLAVDRARLVRTVLRELGLAYAALAQAQALSLSTLPGADAPRAGAEAARALLHSALLEKVEAVEARVFALLAELYPEAGIEYVYAGIRDAAARDAARLRANAVELLDNVLDREVKRRLIPLLEDTPREHKLRSAEETYPQPARSSERALLELLADENPWVRSCACHLAHELKLASAQDALVLNLNSPWPVLREAALASLEGMPPRSDLPILLERARKDESPLVRARAEALRPASRPPPSAKA